MASGSFSIFASELPDSLITAGNMNNLENSKSSHDERLRTHMTINMANLQSTGGLSSANLSADRISNLARRITQRISDKDWLHSDLQNYVMPNIDAYLPHSDTPFVSGRDAYIEDYRIFSNKYPGYKCEILGSSINVDEEKGSAEAWMLLRVVGCPDTVQRENVTITHWCRRPEDGSWAMQRQTGIRGANGYW